MRTYTENSLGLWTDYLNSAANFATKEIAPLYLKYQQIRHPIPVYRTQVMSPPPVAAQVSPYSIPTIVAQGPAVNPGVNPGYDPYQQAPETAKPLLSRTAWIAIGGAALLIGAVVILRRKR